MEQKWNRNGTEMDGKGVETEWKRTERGEKGVEKRRKLKN
jgi:hypothetical protein